MMIYPGWECKRPHGRKEVLVLGGPHRARLLSWWRALVARLWSCRRALVARPWRALKARLYQQQLTGAQ